MKAEVGIRIAEGSEGNRCAPAIPHSDFRNPPSLGLTLIELLVVIAILAILLGAAIPVLSPASDARRIREASRGLNSFIAGAKVRAKETGRPFGIALKKLSQETGNADANGASLELYYVEEPPPYAGFDSNARVMLGTDAVSGGAVRLHSDSCSVCDRRLRADAKQRQSSTIARSGRHTVWGISSWGRSRSGWRAVQVC